MNSKTRLALLATLLTSCTTPHQNRLDMTRSTHEAPREASARSAQAVLVLDMQRDFCDPAGKMHGLVADELERTGVVDKTVTLINAAREAGAVTYVTPILFDYSAPPARLPEGIAAPIVENRAFDRDGVGGELIPEIKALVDGDRVCRLPKPSLSAFAGTGLHEELQAKGIEEVVIAGLVTNYCVESTARDAFDLGYRVRIVEDATAGFDLDQRRFALDTVFPMLGRVITVGEFASPPVAGSVKD